MRIPSWLVFRASIVKERGEQGGKEKIRHDVLNLLAHLGTMGSFKPIRMRTISMGVMLPRFSNQRICWEGQGGWKDGKKDEETHGER